MEIKANKIESVEYVQTFGTADLERYMADPWQWREDVRAQLGLDKPANGNRNGHHAPTAATKRASKRSAKKVAKSKAPKARSPKLSAQLLQCSQCPKTFKTQGRLNNHVADIHGATAPEAPTWTPASAAAAAE